MADRRPPPEHVAHSVAQQLSYAHGCHRDGKGGLVGPCSSCREVARQALAAVGPQAPAPA